ncbi:MAG: hypothetical protein Q9191_004611 [Dirinaria sp. TL-2023a]
MPAPEHQSGDRGSATPDQSRASNSSPVLPPPPEPSADKGIAPRVGTSADEGIVVPDADQLDIFTLAPVAALKMLCDTVETLVQTTGDIPPTPPISGQGPLDPHMVQARIKNAAKHAMDSLRDGPPTDSQNEAPQPDAVESNASPSEHHSDVPPRAKTPIGSPEAHPTEPLQVVGANVEPLDVQQGAITRKFYSKRPPPISLEEYLFRLHKYCPMSTAVYLATSLYIHRLAVVEKTLPVTAKNVHRLLLAGLRVAMKALEDLSYPHTRFAKVGGVTEPELGRLEVSFCFVTNFDMRVTAEMLLKHAKSVRDGQSYLEGLDSSQPLPPTQNMRQLPLRQPMAAVKPIGVGAHAAA